MVENKDGKVLFGKKYYTEFEGNISDIPSDERNFKIIEDINLDNFAGTILTGDNNAEKRNRDEYHFPVFSSVKEMKECGLSDSYIAYLVSDLIRNDRRNNGNSPEKEAPTADSGVDKMLDKGISIEDMERAIAEKKSQLASA